MLKPVTTVQDGASTFANAKAVDVSDDGSQRFNIYKHDIVGKF